MNLIQRIIDYKVPAGTIAIWWLGQAGYIVKSPQGKIVTIDPYLTNSCKAVGEKFGYNMNRLIPAPLEPADLAEVDVYAITHSHPDHLDPETVEGYRKAGGDGPCVAPAEAIEKLKSMGIPTTQLEMIWPNGEYVCGDITLRATFAIPLGSDDLTHVGYLIKIKDGPTLYITGDTAYHEILADALADDKPDILITVINGAFKNLCPSDAARLADKLDVKIAIPCHYDMFPDNSLAPEIFRTNLKMHSKGDCYKELSHGKAYIYPEI